MVSEGELSSEKSPQPKKYDAVFKQMLDRDSPDWVRYLAPRLGISLGDTLKALDADLSTVSAQPDKLFDLGGDRGIVHLEVQSSYDADLPNRVLLYNVLAVHRYRPPVRSVVMLLRPQAQASTITGLLERKDPSDEVYLRFKYAVIRIWEQSWQSMIAGGVGMWPLALVTDDAVDHVPEVVAAIDAHVREAKLTRSREAEFWTTCQVVMGLRYKDTQIQHWLMRSDVMEESTSYQAIMEKGEARGARASIRRLGEKQFGPPTALQQSRLAGVTELEHLNRILDAVVDVASWDELLDVR